MTGPSHETTVSGGGETLDDQARGAGSERAAPKTPALVVLWCRDEPWRAGEVIFLDDTPRELGRGAESERGGARAVLVRQRPGSAEPQPPLESPRISRVQLVLRAGDGGGCVVENVGRCKLLVDGDEIAEATETQVASGSVIEIAGQLSLLVSSRPAWIAPLRAPYPSFAFGEADAHGVVGESPAAWRLREWIAFVARRPGHVLVRGASGTGKELVARAIHDLSSRASRPMVSRNAATIPEGLVDAELFGNMKNYPNAGMEARPGMIGEADGSTLFLDEIAEVPSSVQAHLLRVLDGGEYTRLGETKPRRADFRLVGATNRPEDALKHDVLARMTFRIEIADLNERREDVPLLVRHLLRRIATRDPEAAGAFFNGPVATTSPRVGPALVRAFVQHAYSTHVRELDQMLWNAIARATGTRLELAGGAPSVGSVGAAEPDDVGAGEGSEAAGEGGDVDAARIQQVLDANNGSIEKTWRALGLASRHVLTRLIKKHGLQVRRTPGR